MLDIRPKLLQLFAYHQAKSSSPSCVIVYLAQKTMSKEMEVSNSWCDILSREQCLCCGFKFASYIVAMPYAVNITAFIVDLFEHCDNMCMMLSLAVNV